MPRVFEGLPLTTQRLRPKETNMYFDNDPRLALAIEESGNHVLAAAMFRQWNMDHPHLIGDDMLSDVERVGWDDEVPF